jgi:hypothetical protein
MIIATTLEAHIGEAIIGARGFGGVFAGITHRRGRWRREGVGGGAVEARPSGAAVKLDA